MKNLQITAEIQTSITRPLRNNIASELLKVIALRVDKNLLA